MADRECWQVFVERIMDLDADGRMIGILQQHRRLAITIFEDRFLSRHYWQDPDAHQRDVIMLGHLLRGIIQVIIDYGADEDWGIMCYPPVTRSG